MADKFLKPDGYLVKNRSGKTYHLAEKIPSRWRGGEPDARSWCEASVYDFKDVVLDKPDGKKLCKKCLAVAKQFAGFHGYVVALDVEGEQLFKNIGDSFFETTAKSPGSWSDDTEDEKRKQLREKIAQRKEESEW